MRPAADYGEADGCRACFNGQCLSATFRSLVRRGTGHLFCSERFERPAIAYIYFEKEARHRHRRSELLARDEAQRIAAIFAKLPELLKRS